ncbi:hypothetical protein SLE2022_336500 [Rubroshorea leprosula]
MNLANARRTKGEDATDDDTPSTSGHQFADSHVSQRFGQSPLPAYEPAFDWENERSMIFGQRTPETPVVHHGSVLKISVKVLSLTFQAGIGEKRKFVKKISIIAFYQLKCRIKLSLEPRGLFHLDAPSASVCLLIQLEKPATEEGGVSPFAYSRKEPVCMKNLYVSILFIFNPTSD